MKKAVFIFTSLLVSINCFSQKTSSLELEVAEINLRLEQTSLEIEKVRRLKVTGIILTTAGLITYTNRVVPPNVSKYGALAAFTGSIIYISADFKLASVVQSLKRRI
jgi:hypothetical protein